MPTVVRSGSGELRQRIVTRGDPCSQRVAVTVVLLICFFFWSTEFVVVRSTLESTPVPK